MLAVNAIGSHDAADSSLKQIKEISEDTGREVRFMMNTYDRSNSTYEEMVADLRHIGSMLTEGVNINFVLDDSIEEDMKEEIVDFMISMHIIRFFKECVVNAVKHSGASEINSVVTIEPHRAIISVKDNGKGFDSNVKKGRGLKNLHRRIAQINGTVHINSDKGTRIICEIPLKDNNG
jgi:signal transduction histidine kinase